MTKKDQQKFLLFWLRLLTGTDISISYICRKMAANAANEIELQEVTQTASPPTNPPGKLIN